MSNYTVTIEQNLAHPGAFAGIKDPTNGLKFYWYIADTATGQTVKECYAMSRKMAERQTRKYVAKLEKRDAKKGK